MWVEPEHQCILLLASSNQANNSISFKLQQTPEPVSYTHLTLPTIYSV